MKTPHRNAHAAVQCLATLAIAGCALWSCAHAAEPKPAKPDGQAVKVTAEMIGAGMVSSGATLSPISPVSGSHEKPVASWSGALP